MGPEHSSARLERFLQLADSDPDVIPKLANDEQVIQKTNLQIVNITTPANYFHALRRQIHRGFRKPLIVMSPKNLLRHRLATSPLKDFEESNTFLTLIPETNTDMVEDSKIRRVLFVTGKVYYDLFEDRQKRNLKDVAIVRIEQIHPFPFAKVQEQLKKYPNAQVCWVQEEPKNMGAWSFIGPHLTTAGKESRGPSFTPSYIGRAPSASPATGFGSEHSAQVAKIMEESFGSKK